MWNTVDGLTKLFYASQWAMAVFGGLTTLAIIVSIVVSVRKDTVIAQEQLRDAAVHKQVVGQQNEQISVLKDQLGMAQDNLKELSGQRSFTREQESKMIETLRSVPFQQIEIVRVDDMETQMFAEQIEWVLHEARWTVLPSLPSLKSLYRFRCAQDRSSA
jgi:hypothetical protein